MKENKGDQSEASEAWDRVGKAVNQTTELYLKELKTYLGWVLNVQRETVEQAITTSQALSRMGEDQFAFLMRLQKSAPYLGAIPTWTEVLHTLAGTAGAPSGRSD